MRPTSSTILRGILHSRLNFSSIERAALSIGVEDTLEVTAFGDYFLNTIEQATMHAKLAGYTVDFTMLLLYLVFS